MSDSSNRNFPPTQLYTLYTSDYDNIRVRKQNANFEYLNGKGGGGGGGESPAYPTYPVGPTAIGGHSLVAVDGSGALVKADCTKQEHFGAVVGITTQAYSAGVQAEPKTSGVIQFSGWNLIPGMVVVVGEDGALTQVLPASAKFSQMIGTALSSNRLIVDIQMPILVNS